MEGWRLAEAAGSDGAVLAPATVNFSYLAASFHGAFLAGYGGIGRTNHPARRLGRHSLAAAIDHVDLHAVSTFSRNH